LERWECEECRFEFQVHFDPETVRENLDAAAFEDAAHGFDFDETHKTDPNTGMSEYDFDPGVEYNDAGEPKGYM
jgi:hypothetical protein